MGDLGEPASWSSGHRWTFLFLVCLAVIGPAIALAQPTAPEAPKTTSASEAERRRGCAVADEAWPAILRATSSAPNAETVFAPWTPSRMATDVPTLTRPDDWHDFVNDTGSGPTPRGKPPNAQLYGKWRRTSEASVFGCEGLTARRGIQVREPVRGPPKGPFGNGFVGDVRMVSVPVVSADGSSALVYVHIARDSMGSGILTHIAKVAGVWRVVGQLPVFNYYQ